jgi:aryl-alcohol dehydrogenase-like predicted oxidoreductase
MGRSALESSLERGCNFFDTAWAYGGGDSDRLLGELIRKHPDREIITASKVPPKNMVFPASSSDKLVDVFPPDHVRSVALRIRDALGVETIDLLQYHLWEDSWVSDGWADVIRELKRDGVIRFFGLSLNRWEPENGIAALESGEVDVVQVIYNIFDQAPEDKLLPVCERLDIGVIARVPLDEGSLGGQMTTSTRFPADDWRAKYFGPENLEPTVHRVDALRRLVPSGMTLPELALRFILENPIVSTTIVGMRRLEHVAANLGVSDGTHLDPGLLEDLRNHRWDRAVTPWAN